MREHTADQELAIRRRRFREAASRSTWPSEGVWCKAWRYINHHRALYSGEIILVTEHGWTDFATRFGGVTPALRSA